MITTLKNHSIITEEVRQSIEILIKNAYQVRFAQENFPTEKVKKDIDLAKKIHQLLKIEQSIKAKAAK
jgi:hypothetical protein